MDTSMQIEIYYVV